MDHEVLSPEQAADVAAWWGKAFEQSANRKPQSSPSGPDLGQYVGQAHADGLVQDTENPCLKTPLGYRPRSTT